jgi:hypothetical protein
MKRCAVATSLCKGEMEEGSIHFDIGVEGMEAYILAGNIMSFAS